MTPLGGQTKPLRGDNFDQRGLGFDGDEDTKDRS
jgi:hypothetical protein